MPITEDGVRVWRAMEEFDTSGAGVHVNWPEGFFARLVDGCLATSANRGGVVGNARCYVLAARELLRFAQPVMERVAADRCAADVLGELPDSQSRTLNREYDVSGANQDASSARNGA